MKKKLFNKNSRTRQAGNPTRPLTPPAQPFLQRPTGVLLICLLLFGLTVWAFFPALKNLFQSFDESAELLKNQHMKGGMSWQNLFWAFFSLEYSNWYPLTWLSHMLDFKVFGEEPWGHHLTNVLLHAANGVLLFLVLKRMTGTLWRSLIVASLFALHPLRVESVAWITERKDVLSAFFGLLALWTYARFAEESKAQDGRSKLYYGLTLLFFALGLMSKSMLVAFPFVLLLLDYWPLQRFGVQGAGCRVQSLLVEKIPFFLLVLPVSIVAYVAQKGGGQFLLRFPMGFRLETALMGYARYLGKMIWPADFSVLYPYPDHWPVGELLLAIVLISGISVLAFVLRRQRPYLLTGWFWYLGMLAPVIGLIPIGAQSMSNRYTYLPMIGILLAAVWAVGDLMKQWRQRTALMTAVVVLILGACVMRTRAEIGYWKDGPTLWKRAITVTENNFMAYYCLAGDHMVTNAWDVLSDFQKSVDIYPDYFSSQFCLANALTAVGRYSNAIAHYEKAAQLEPQNAWTYHNLGTTLYLMGRIGESVPALLKAVEIIPQENRYKDDLAQRLFFSGHHAETFSNFLVAVRTDPAGFSNFWAFAQFDTNQAPLISNLALCFATYPDPNLRNGDYALRLATRSCEMTGFRKNYCVIALAMADAENSRFDEAITNAQLACSLTYAADQPELLKRYQALLELFRSRQPYHEFYD